MPRTGEQSDQNELKRSIMPLKLNATQRRVLAVLMEKSFTTPEQYPITINSLQSGCNQKSNRNPVYDYSEGDVVNAVQELMHLKLAGSAPPQPGARANRYEHCVTKLFPWAPHEQAILCELLLRGPQTVGELRTRAGRMVHIADLQTVQNTLDALQENDTPEIVAMPREAGRSVLRYRHNFYPDDDLPESGGIPSGPTSGVSPEPPPPGVGIRDRLDELETRVADLENRLDSFTGG